MIHRPYRLPPQATRLMTGQLLASMHSCAHDGLPVLALDATGLQLQGALDAFCTYDGPLGYRRVTGSGGGAVTLWAPTAQKV